MCIITRDGTTSAVYLTNQTTNKSMDEKIFKIQIEKMFNRNTLYKEFKGIWVKLNLVWTSKSKWNILTNLRVWLWKLSFQELAWPQEAAILPKTSYK